MPRELIVSPRGEALWAKVLGEAADGYEEGDPRAWSISLLLDPNDPETLAFIERLEAQFEAMHGKGVKVAANGWPFADETTKDEKGRPVPTGKVKFNFKRKEFTAKGNAKPAPVVVDAKKKAWPQDMLIGNGSKVKIAFSPWSWSGASGKGMSLELESLQVLDLVPFDKPAATDAFDEEEGFEVITPESETPFAAEPEPQGFSAQLRARAAQVMAEANDLEEEVPF
jgi:hypothetical protein